MSALSGYSRGHMNMAAELIPRWDALTAALSSPSFYIEMLLIGMSLSLAWVLAAWLRRRVQQRLKAFPPKHVDSEFITRPMAMLGPALALIFLSAARPFVAQHVGGDGDWTDAVIEVCAAYALAKFVLLIVRSRPVAWFIAVVIMTVGILRSTGFIHSTVSYLRSVSFDIGQFHITMLNIVHAVVILVVVFWIAGALSRTLESFLRRTSSLSYNARELIVKFFRIFVYFLALMITLSALGVDLTAFAVFGGALGVGIGLGLQKITANFVSGITLLMEKSIQIGDLIEVGGNTGRVRHLNIRYALIETSDGREVMIPNEELVSTRVTNWTHTNNLGRIDITVGVAYDSDPARVIALMTEAANEHPRCLKSDKDRIPACYLREFADSSLNFLLTFWVADVRDGRFAPQSDVMISVLKKFRAAGIDIPFPQREVRMVK
ncbi:MAG: mechanosensitive ion channel [Pseudomonadota bacterium]|nr:mechanosensitive ion channel [Pseudomonadota bacterium]